MTMAHAALSGSSACPQPEASRTDPKHSTLSGFDQILAAGSNALRTLFSAPQAARPTPQAGAGAVAKTQPATGQTPELPPTETAAPLSDAEKRHAAGLMRVNHTGEICAQALYTAQAMVTRNPVLKQHLAVAAQEETDHLAWTAERLQQLGSRPSLLNPLWYAGAFTIGVVAGKIGGDPLNLGFVVATENQVEAHLQGHLDELPEHDHASRAIVAQMKIDEAQHAQAAIDLGALELPVPVRHMMRMAAKVMTTVAYRI